LLVFSVLGSVVDVDIDTGSGVLWVTDIGCRGCNVSNAKLFDAKLSSTQHSDGSGFEIIYGQGRMWIIVLT
jgi:hypothetical protein